MRLAKKFAKSTDSGKSNGYRLIYYVVIDEKIYLLTIYSKKDDNRVPNDKQISIMIKILLRNKKIYGTPTAVALAWILRCPAKKEWVRNLFGGGK